MSTALAPAPFILGERLVSGTTLNRLFGFPVVSSQNAVTAHAGGGQTNALPTTAQITNISVVATTADSVKLPPALPGMSRTLINSATNSMQVFGTGADTINAVATATGVAQAGGVTTTYFCPVAGQWFK